MSKPTILLAEDEAMLRMIAVEILQDAGFQVFEAGDGVDRVGVGGRGGDALAQRQGSVGSEDRDFDFGAAEVDADTVLGHGSGCIMSGWLGCSQCRRHSGSV